MLYDTHCHLNYHTDEELRGIIARAKQEDLKYIMHAGSTISEIDREIDICNKFSDAEIQINCAVATHPENVLQDGIISPDKLSQIAKKSDKIKAIGETGLDTHKAENEDFFNKQVKSFENHIEVAISLNLPLIIHSREEKAVSKVIEILQYYKNTTLKSVLHSYTGDVENAQKALDIGCNISFSGIATFKNANDVREIVKIVPISQMFVETDAPFLAPVPMRGKQNETSFVAYTARFLSEFLNIDYNIFGNTTTNNAKKFFKNV